MKYMWAMPADQLRFSAGSSSLSPLSVLSRPYGTQGAGGRSGNVLARVDPREKYAIRAVVGAVELLGILSILNPHGALCRTSRQPEERLTVSLQEWIQESSMLSGRL